MQLQWRNLTEGLKKNFHPAWVVYFALCFLAWLTFSHTDILETANHSYLLLESIFKGRFLYFYEDVVAHQNAFQYFNAAHYNIVVYIVFAVAELPLYIIWSLLGAQPNETVLMFLAKFVCIVFFMCGVALVARLAQEMGADENEQRWASFAFALWPPAFFATMVMGQYDSLCLCVMLLAVLRWLQGRYLPSAFWFGLAAGFKFFPLLLFLPLFLLVEKRPLHLLKYGVCAMWLLLPTSILFALHPGDTAVFNSQMSGFLTSSRIMVASEIPLFPFFYGLLCVAVYFWRPTNTKEVGLWVCLAAYGIFFIFVRWHPQWVLLIAPFVVLTTLSRRRLPGFYWIDTALSVGFFLICFYGFPGGLEAGLLSNGLLKWITGSQVMGGNQVGFYISLFPLIDNLPMALFVTALSAHLFLKLPLPGGSPAERLQGKAPLAEVNHLRAQWLVFGAGMLFWLVPTLYTWVKFSQVV